MVAPDQDFPRPFSRIVARKASQLYRARMDAENTLLMLSLPLEGQAKKEHLGAIRVVNLIEHPVEYGVVNAVRDWMAEHIGAFDRRAQTVPTMEGGCDHANGCHTLAGFYHVIATGGNAYLNADAVRKELLAGGLAKDNPASCKRVAVALEALKTAASTQVAAFVTSELQLDRNDDIEYLTCSTVGWEVPPGIENDTESDVEMDEY